MNEKQDKPISGDQDLIEELMRLRERVKTLESVTEKQDKKIAEQDTKIAEQGEKIAEQDTKIAQQDEKIEQLQSDIKEMQSDIDVTKSFIAAMGETKSFEQTMTEVQSVTKQITGCDSAEFMCFDKYDKKFFSSDDGKTRNWQPKNEKLNEYMRSPEVIFEGDNKEKAFIPVAAGGHTPIGVIVAEKQRGFDENDLRLFSHDGDIMSTIDLAIRKEELHLIGNTDNLTHLKNRNSLDEYVANTFAPSIEKGDPVSIVMLDIDKFKNVNDTYGHKEGDAVLKGVAKILHEHTRKGCDAAFRFGGEEMIGVFNCPPEDAIAAAERLRKAIEEAPLSTKVTVSIGICSVKSKDFEKELKRADDAVYAAKETGRNRVVSNDFDLMKDYLVTRAAKAIIEAGNFTDTVQNIKNTVLKDRSLDEISNHLFALNTPLAERVCEQIDQFAAANDYFSAKREKSAVQSEKIKSDIPEAKVETDIEFASMECSSVHCENIADRLKSEGVEFEITDLDNGNKFLTVDLNDKSKLEKADREVKVGYAERDRKETENMLSNMDDFRNGIKELSKAAEEMNKGGQAL